MQQTEKRTKGTVIVNQLSAIHRLEQKQGIRNSRKEEEDIYPDEVITPQI